MVAADLIFQQVRAGSLKMVEIPFKCWEKPRLGMVEGLGLDVRLGDATNTPSVPQG